jgi:hypothetical protein
MCSLGCPIRNASLKVAYFEVPIPGRFSLPADMIQIRGQLFHLERDGVLVSAKKHQRKLPA